MSQTLSRLGWDLRSLPADGSPGTGIAHAARELWAACVPLAASYGVELIAFTSSGSALDEGATVIRLPSTRAWSLRRALAHHPVDQLFCPSGSVPLGVQVPAIPWIHDLAIFDHPEWFPQSRLRRFFTTTLVKKGMQRASKVLVVSQDVAHAVTRIGGIESSRVIVTGQGIDLPAATEVLPVEIPPRYALILGTVEPRKNVSFIIDLWPDVCRRLNQQIPLVIAGGDGWGMSLPTLPASVIRLPRVSDALRLTLLKQAALVLVPSCYEGFGRVAAEAILSAVPVIASNRGSHPEIIQDSAPCLPLIRDRWLQAILQALKSPPTLESLEEQATRRSPDFSWENVAHRVLANLANN